MKKASFLLNLLLIGFITFQSFRSAKTTSGTQESCTQVCMDYSAGNIPFKMNSNVLQMMYANYKYGQTPPGSLQQPGADAQTAWFSLGTLKRFLWQIETEVCKRAGKCKAIDSLGVRFYYARYPENKPVPGTGGVNLWSQYTDLTSVPKRYEKQHTFFMVPTFDINGIHTDFDPYNTTYVKCRPTVTLEKLLKTVKTTKESITIFNMEGSMSISALAPDPDPAAKNHSELCPPYPQGQSTCPGVYFQ